MRATLNLPAVLVLLPAALLVAACTSAIPAPAPQTENAGGHVAKTGAIGAVAEMKTLPRAAPAEPISRVDIPMDRVALLPTGDGSSLALKPVQATASRLAPYSLVYEEPGTQKNSGILRLSSGAPLPSGIIWCDAGYWGCQIVRIEGIEVAPLTRHQWYDLIFRGEEPAHLEVRLPSGKRESIEAFTHKGRVILGPPPRP